MTGIIEFLSHIDAALFHFFNGTLANPAFDKIMPAITSTGNLRLAVFPALLFWLWKGGNKGRWAVLYAAFAWSAADFINSNFIKEIFERPRPCLTLPDVHLLVGCGQTYSFPSGHAVTSFALATFLTLIYPRAKWFLFPLAFLISYSRIAVGVHYPFDILAGMLLGGLCGYLFYRLFVFQQNFWQKKNWRGSW